jgi:hypothetical protein
MRLEDTYLFWLIVACEVGFWLLLIAALAARYIARRDLLSKVLLVSLPILDVLLLVFTAIDLREGRIATFAHGLATAYVGFTVAFGSLIVQWADERFAYWFANGPPPSSAATYGWAAVAYELMLWARCVVAAVIICVLIVLLILFVDNPANTEPLRAWFRVAAGSVIFWFVFGPLWSIVFFRRPRP